MTGHADTPQHLRWRTAALAGAARELLLGGDGAGQQAAPQGAEGHDGDAQPPASPAHVSPAPSSAAAGQPAADSPDLHVGMTLSCTAHAGISRWAGPRKAACRHSSRCSCEHSMAQLGVAESYAASGLMCRPDAVMQRGESTSAWRDQRLHSSWQAVIGWTACARCTTARSQCRRHPLRGLAPSAKFRPLRTSISLADASEMPAQLPWSGQQLCPGARYPAWLHKCRAGGRCTQIPQPQTN